MIRTVKRNRYWSDLDPTEPKKRQKWTIRTVKRTTYRSDPGIYLRQQTCLSTAIITRHFGGKSGYWND